MRFKCFDIRSAANDPTPPNQDSWALLVDHTGAVTLAEFLKSEPGEKIKSGVVDSLKTAGIAANDR